MREVPHCHKCDRRHWNVVPCEKVVAQEKKRAPEHWMLPGSVPWGAGFSYHSRPAATRTKAHRINTITPPRKEEDGAA